MSTPNSSCVPSYVFLPVSLFFPGIQDDEDVKQMLQGSSMVKVRSARWQKQRILKLLDDGVTVWCQSQKTSSRAKEQQSCELVSLLRIQTKFLQEGTWHAVGKTQKTLCYFHDLIIFSVQSVFSWSYFFSSSVVESRLDSTHSFSLLSLPMVAAGLIHFIQQQCRKKAFIFSIKSTTDEFFTAATF